MAVRLKLSRWLSCVAQFCCWWLSVCLTVAVAAETTNQLKTVAEPKQNQDELKSLRQEAVRLKEQNQQLRIENQKLRRLLADQGEATSPALGAAGDIAGNTTRPQLPVAASTNSVTTATSNGPTHWLTKSSGKRHNSRCKFYQKTEGRFCTPSEGLPCTVCGG